MTANMIRTNLSLPAELWRAVIRAAAREQARTGEPVSAAEWIRQAIERALAK